MGFDNECILNIQSLAGEYFCPVCRLLVYPNEAIQTQCTHLYCKPCLTYIVSTTRACPYDGYLVTEADSKPLLESNKPLAETISKIAVHCLYHRSGCTWQGPLSECTSHCSGCAFGNSPVVCNRCGIQIVHREVQEHAQNCSSVQLQAQQSEGASGVGASGTAVTGANQNQVVVQAGPTSTQTPASQAGAAQDASQHANANTPAVAQASASVPAPEQWYQQHQQYQQYYQQYPGYDPYQQQYLHYYPYQQQPVQQYQQQPLQAQPSLVPGQNQGQVYAQPVVQPQPLPQAQSILQPNSQPPDQPLINTQLQPQLHAQASVAPQNQSQMQVNLQKQMQVPPQAHPPAHCQPLSHPQPYLQAQPYPPTLHSQIPQNQQPHPQMQYPQPQAQISTHPQHPQNQPFPQPLPHSQPPSQVLLQHHLVHPHPRPPVQPSQTPIANSVFQAPHSSAPAVSGLQSYAQSHSYLQMSAGVPQHQPTNMSIQSGPHQQSQNPAQISGQLPQPPQMRLPQSHPPMANQQLTSLPPHGQGSIVPSVQQHPFYPQTQQPDYPVQQQQPFTQAMQQAMPQYVQQQHQGYLGQPSGMVQKGTFPQQQQQQQQPIQTASRPQGPPQALQQPSTVPQFPQQNVALSNVMVSQYQPNHAARPMMPNQGLQSQPSSQSHGGGVVQSRPLQPSSTQLSTIQNYSSKVNSQLQPPSEHHHAAIQQSEAPLKSMMLDRQNNPNNESSGVEQEAALQKSGLKDASGVEAEMKHIQSESDSKLVAHGQQHTAVDSQAGISTKDIPEPACTESGVPETGVTENGSIYPSIKQMKQETATNAFETSSTGKSVEIVEENKDASGLDHKQAEVASFEEKEIQEVREHESDKLQIVTSVDGGLVQPLIRNTRGSEVVPGPASASSTSIQNVFPKDQIIGSESDNIQLHEKDFSRPSHPVPYTDQGRLMLPPTHYGPSHYQQRPDALASLQSLPPQGPSHLVQAPLPRPRVPGPSPHSGQPLTAPEHFQAHMLKQPHGSFHSDGPPGAVLGGASAAPFGMGPSHFDPYQKNFEHHPTAHVHYEQGHVPIGIPKASSGSFDSAAGLTTRVPTQPGPSGRVGSEFISNQRSGYHEQGPIGHHPDVQSKLFKMDAPPFFDSASAFGLRNERFKPMREEHTTPLPMEPPRHAVDRGEFDDLRRPPNLDGGLFPKTGSYNSFSRPFDAIPHNAAPRPLDKGPHGYNYDELGSNKSIGHPRFLPPYHHNDINGRASHPFARTDFLGQAPGFVQHHMDVRSPPKEFPVIPPRGFGGFPGAPGNRSGLDGIEGRESQPLGDGSKSFDLSSNSMMNPFHEGRYPVLPSRLHRGDIDLPGHLRLGEPPVGFAGGPGNFLPRPRPGEPGFRSSYSQHGYSTDGFYTGAMESFDNTRKTKQASMGWCRICKVDCETVEGLDLHSQTREHQKIAMDIVLSIKQQNRKKHKTSNDHSSLEEASKPRNVPLDGRGNKH